MKTSRPAGSKVRHGTATCGNYGCTKPECVRAYRLDRSRWWHERQQGIHGRVPTAPATLHIRRLLLAGMSLRDIAQRAGVGETTVARVHRGGTDVVFRVTAESILGVPIPTVPSTPGQRGLITAAGSRKRLQALTACGYPVNHLASQYGFDQENLAAIRRGHRRHVQIATHLDIARLYDELRNVDPIADGVSKGHVQNARLRAARNGWPMPADLDDDRIDWDDEVAA